ncbi:DEAD/DEAH box helicase [Jiella sp. MQZ9-1]|uniref:DEAD-box ATP-dependent RNA helicase RhpA n=1 Tax=Jiella flava TaxID=2816857 RepID=A0A939JS74_9HYPH|nr:DEAD/DEAH box helicase [Jiella flava]MBO0662673.1 DEAD/DEAH box helicase [Jiella flava]MCD2471095.1 DEAD/DEAH box helicase [Jiella flava]
MTLFSDLGLSAKVQAAVEAAGYKEPTPIQAEAIPHALERRDVLGIAQTGTGKTASFVLPMLTILEKGRARARMPRTLIIEPTRELAAQVEESFTRYGKDQKLNVALLIGGMSFDEQDRKIDRGADVLIATPGRLLDHFERGKLLLTGVEILVIDEADRMLDMGFIPDIEKICKLLPFTRQTLFFSATMPPEITRLTEQFLQNPVRVEVAKQASAALTVTQRLVAAGRKEWDKRDVLRTIVREQDDLTNAIIFCNRKRDVSTLFRSLEKHGFSAGALHGDMDQRARMMMLHNFREDKIQLLVASDVAARGLDIPKVSHVFNFDVPIHAEDYVHRIGRTGRAGRSGKAFTLVTKADKKYLDAIEKMIGTSIEWHGTTIADLVEEPDEDDRSRRRGGRKPAGEKTERRGRRSRSEAKVEAADADETNANVLDRAEAGELDMPVEAIAERPTAKDNTASRATSASYDRGTTSSRARPKRNVDAPKNSGRQRGEETNQLVGFGDDIPAFMLIETGA